jgi:VanZ family protein
MLNAPSPSPRRHDGRTRLLGAWLPPIAWAALIFYLSSLPGSAIPSPFFSADKIFHLGAYAVLGYLVARALAYYGRTGRVMLMPALLLCLLYGMSDEFHQSFVPDRTPSVLDVAADTIGACIGIVIRTRKR